MGGFRVWRVPIPSIGARRVKVVVTRPGEPLPHPHAELIAITDERTAESLLTYAEEDPPICRGMDIAPG